MFQDASVLLSHVARRCRCYRTCSLTINILGDEESAELAQILKDNDPATATEKLTGLEKTHPLFDRVKERVQKVQV